MNMLSFVTGNTGKFYEIQTFLEGSGIQVQQIIVDLEEIQEVDAHKVMEHKTHAAIRAGYTNFFLEDTSLHLNGMGHLPGPFIKWFLMELGTTGIAKMAKRMGDTAAYAETIIAYVNWKKEIRYFSGKTRGHIVVPKGKGDFGWGAIFRPEGAKKTFAQMTDTEKHLWSMRIKAFKKYRTFLLKG